ncbi:hypothetical protein Hanom_Chr15g01412921 [Helianthus anomalus]
MTVKLPVKPVWLKDPTQVSLSLLSLPTSASLCTKWESNLHLSREMQDLHQIIGYYLKYYVTSTYIRDKCMDFNTTKLDRETFFLCFF